jgi:hypothetical protein
MKHIEKFEGCGSFNSAIQTYIEKDLHNLNNLFKSLLSKDKADKKSHIKAWLTACLIKTLKEQVELSVPLIEFET